MPIACDLGPIHMHASRSMIHIIQVIGGFLGAAALVASGVANAATPINIIDDRKARDTGFDIIYEARDLDIPQNEREGFTQARADLEGTRKRVLEAENRIDTALDLPISKAYW